MKWGAAFLHPAGLGVLACSVLLAGLLAAGPGLADRSDRAPAVALMGVVAYGAVALVAARWPPTSPPLRRLRAARRDIARLLAEGKRSAATVTPASISPATARRRLLAGEKASASPGLETEWDRLAAEALSRLDEEIGPALAQLVERTADLRGHLTTYERARQTPPDQVLLERLRSIYARQDSAMAACVQQVVNAEAKLIGLLQVGGGMGAADGLRPWLADFAAIQAELVAALEGRWESDGAVLAAPPSKADPAPEVSPPPLPQPPDEGAALLAAVKAALQHLNKPATLARCELAGHLPRTLAAVRKTWGEAHPAPPTPLGQAQALREALIAAIERLKAGEDEANEQNLPHLILHQEYVLGSSTKRIMVRYAVAEATLHRRRQDGIRALAVELATWEKLLARRDNAVAMDYLG